MRERALQTELERLETDLVKKLEKKEIGIEQALEHYMAKRVEIEAINQESNCESAQRQRKAPAVGHFITASLQRARKISAGCGFFNQLRLLVMAILQSVPNRTRKRYHSIDLIVNNGMENLCKRLVVKVNDLAYAVQDYQGFNIVSSEFETFMSEWFQPRKGDVFVDIGSHIGKYSIAASKVVGNEGVVVAVESHPSNYETLKRNIKLNNSKNIVAFNLAAWDRQCTLQFFIGPTSAVSNIDRYCYGCGSIEVQGERMDKLVNNLGLKRVDWIKIDVEAAEHHVLLGLEETLSKFKPKLILEVWRRNMGQVKTFLDIHGYRFVKFSGFGEAQSEWFVDVLCVPDSAQLV